jgi:hypothetical protein
MPQTSLSLQYGSKAVRVMVSAHIFDMFTKTPTHLRKLYFFAGDATYCRQTNCSLRGHREV